MPTYDYSCEACGAAHEFFQPMSEAPKRKCPSCGKLKLKRQIGAGGGLIFKGSGFYLTDYRSDSYKKGEAAENKSPEPKAESKSESKGAKDSKSSKPSKPDKKQAS